MRGTPLTTLQPQMADSLTSNLGADTKKNLKNKLSRLPIPNYDLYTAQRIKSVEVCNLGSSVVAGLVPATNPWYGIFPTHQRD